MEILGNISFSETSDQYDSGVITIAYQTEGDYACPKLISDRF